VVVVNYARNFSRYAINVKTGQKNLWKK